MRTQLICLLTSAVLYVGCVCPQPVEFAFFNLSGHEIVVNDVAGLPPNATPGVLMPVLDDTNRLNEKCAVLYERVRVGDRIKIIWTEADKPRELELQRSELAVPARLKGGKLRFTYLGDGKWRVKLL